MAILEFAIADWHYDPSDHRCPHDTWLEALTIREIAQGERMEQRSIEINIRLLGAYHDGHVELTYKGVKSYSFVTPHEFETSPSQYVGHGDWQIDEIRLSNNGFVVHEIVFTRGSVWVIECEDLSYEWKPSHT